MVVYSFFEFEFIESVYGSFGLYKVKIGVFVIMVLKSLKLIFCFLVYFYLEFGDVFVNLWSNVFILDNIGRNFLKYFISFSEGSNFCWFLGFCI